jgi:hypothetical protein
MHMKLIIIALLTMFISLLTYGQESKDSLPTATNDTFFHYLDNLRTNNLEYFDLDPNTIKDIFVIKGEDEKNIYGNKAHPILIHFKKRYYKNLKLGQILKTDFYDTIATRFFIDNIPSTRDNTLSIFMKDFKKIEFVNQDSSIIEIRLTKLNTNK